MKKKVVLIVVSLLILILVIIGILTGLGLIKLGNRGEKERIEQYNQTFTRYVGNQTSGSDVMALCDNIKTHNENVGEDNEERKISIKFEGEKESAEPQAIISAKSKMRSDYTYTVKCEYHRDGNVKMLIIKKN